MSKTSKKKIIFKKINHEFTQLSFDYVEGKNYDCFNKINYSLVNKIISMQPVIIQKKKNKKSYKKSYIKSRSKAKLYSKINSKMSPKKEDIDIEEDENESDPFFAELEKDFHNNKIIYYDHLKNLIYNSKKEVIGHISELGEIKIEKNIIKVENIIKVANI